MAGFSVLRLPQASSTGAPPQLSASAFHVTIECASLLYVRMPVCQASSSVWALAQPQPTVPHNCLASFSPVNIAERSFVGVGDGRAAQPLGTAWLHGVGRPSSGVPTVFPICHMYVSNQAGREPQLCNKSWARVAKVQIAAWNPA